MEHEAFDTQVSGYSPPYKDTHILVSEEADENIRGSEFTCKALDYVHFPMTKQKENENFHSDLVIGVVDSRFDPTWDCFSDDHICTTSNRNFNIGSNNGFICTSKVVGFKTFAAHPQAIRQDVLNEHGTACAAIASGDYIDADFYGIRKGTIRGSLPKSRLSLYECDLGGYNTCKGVVEAALDNVDVISASIGPDKATLLKYMCDPTPKLFELSIGTLVATFKDILCCVPAGNYDGVGEVVNYAPWEYCSGACNIDYRFDTMIALGDGQIIQILEKEDNCPVLLNTSGKGPNPMAPDFIKPDGCAPGQVLVPTKKNQTRAYKETREDLCDFRFMSGTSGATALVAGVVAYLKSIHPTFSAAALKSALMTTARLMKIKTDQDTQGIGSGMIDVVAAAAVGLVYDIHPTDYLRCLNWLNIKISTNINDEVTKLADQAALLDTLHPRDLNLPSFGATFGRGEKSYVFPRTLKSVCSVPSEWKCYVEPVDGLFIQPRPNVLVFQNENEENNFELHVEVQDWDKAGKYGFRTYIEWRSNESVVRSFVMIWPEKWL